MLALIDPAILILAAVVVSMAFSFLFVRIFIRNRIGRRITELEVRLGSEWSLALISEPGRKYNLCFAFSIEHPGGEDDYGLIAEYSCFAGNRPVFTEKAGIGYLVADEEVRRIGSQYNVSLTSVGGQTRYRASVVLCTIGPADGRTEIKATGKLASSPGVELKKGEIFFSEAR